MPTSAPNQLPLFDVDEPDENHPSKRLSRAEYLQRKWDKSGLLMEAEIVFRPHKGWYAEPFYPRYFDDEGEYLGDTWRDAAEAISWILSGVSHDHPDY